jgi:hypothetical protein
MVGLQQEIFSFCLAIFGEGKYFSKPVTEIRDWNVYAYCNWKELIGVYVCVYGNTKIYKSYIV